MMLEFHLILSCSHRESVARKFLEQDASFQKRPTMSLHVPGVITGLTPQPPLPTSAHSLPCSPLLSVSVLTLVRQGPFQPSLALVTFLSQASSLTHCLDLQDLHFHVRSYLHDPMKCSLPDSSLHGFPRQEYWSRLPFPTPEDLPDPETKL